MRLLFWDLETALAQVGTFSLWERGGLRIPHENILSEGYIVCASWKWAGEKKVHSVATTDRAANYKKNPHDDTFVVKTLYNVLLQADVLVAHNGDQFDTKYFATRALAAGLPPLPPIPSVDTLKVAKSRFRFTSNRLAYLGPFLGLGEKLHTSPGLWMRVLRGDRTAVEEMRRYNKQDVLLLEAVFEKLRPFVKLSTVSADPGECPRCGGANLQRRGVFRTAAREYQRFQCTSCGGWLKAVKAETTDKRARVL